MYYRIFVILLTIFAFSTSLSFGQNEKHLDKVTINNQVNFSENNLKFYLLGRNSSKLYFRKNINVYNDSNNRITVGQSFCLAVGIALAGTALYGAVETENTIESAFLLLLGSAAIYRFSKCLPSNEFYISN